MQKQQFLSIWLIVSATGKLCSDQEQRRRYSITKQLTVTICSLAYKDTNPPIINHQQLFVVTNVQSTELSKELHGEIFLSIIHGIILTHADD